MKYSKLFGKTIKLVPKDISLVSHKLLYQGGFIRESTAGRYYFLPLGWLVHMKIHDVIKEEMDYAGGQEMITPVMHPKALWEETNRTTSVGFELMSVRDRNEIEFVLGGTAEEMLVDVVRKFQLSYKDLPFNVYQFSTKFRDEKRARGGLLRLREFVMKDAYSFDTAEGEFKKEYEKMKNTYKRIFDRFGLHTVVVESDNGYIGGEYCHEFVVEHDAGESKFFMTQDGSYAAHEDIAQFVRDMKNGNQGELPMKKVDAQRGNTIEEGVLFHDRPAWQQIKCVMLVDENKRMILAVIRGDYEVNEVKLLHVAKAYQLRHATKEEVRALGSEPGFISPVKIRELVQKSDISLLIIGDTSLRTIKNAYTGANEKYKDFINVNIDRDYTLDIEADIALAKEGYIAGNGKKLLMKRGIEVGNIFQLGFHYTAKMKDATYTDESGKQQPYYMGCYGIGLARTLATIVECYHDDKGIYWPQSVSPFSVHLMGLGSKEKADEIYKHLTRDNISVLYDDRDVSAGEKFADADLIGIPVRLVISNKTGNKIEWKNRKETKTSLLSYEQVRQALTASEKE